MNVEIKEHNDEQDEETLLIYEDSDISDEINECKNSLISKLIMKKPVSKQSFKTAIGNV